MTSTNEYDVVITKIDESWMKVQCADVCYEYEIQNEFAFEIPDAQHDPLVKAGRWDGIKRLYNRKTKRLGIGLLFKLLKFLKNQQYSYYVDPKLVNIDNMSYDDIENVVYNVIKPVDEEGNPITLYPHQLKAIHHMLNMGRSVCLSATSSGKSLIIYIVARIYQLLDEFEGKHILITTDSGNLVEQMYGDFDVYSAQDENWNVYRHCQRVNKDYKKGFNNQIIISTWQSAKKFKPYEMNEVMALFVDEVHKAKADVLSSIVESATNTPIKHGLTGSLDRTESNETFIESLFGPKKKIIGARESIEKGVAADIKVNMLVLEYDEESRKQLHAIKQEIPKKEGSKRYKAEIDFVDSHEKRQKFITNLAQSMSGNTLILYEHVDALGIPVYERISKKVGEENVHIIHGDIGNEERQRIKERVESTTGQVVVASFGTMAIGVSMKNLHNLIVISSTKSSIRIVQSLGRMMRKHASKLFSSIYDITDDLKYGKDKCYCIEHAQQRVSLYCEERHPIKFFPVKL